MSSLRLDWCTYEAAKYAVEHWHYSQRMPASKLAKVGVWEDGVFIGVVIFGVGATPKLVNPYGLKQHEGCELVRVALRDHKSEVSKIVAIAIRMVKKRYPGLKLIISFADPREGHVGRIYQAGNWIYLGRTAADRFPILDGRIAHPRTLSDRVARGTVTCRKDVPHVRVPGKHRYAYPLDDAVRDRIIALRQPYPKASEVGDGSTPGAQRRCDSDPDAPT